MSTMQIDTNEFLTPREAAEVIGDIDVESVQRYCLNHEQGRTPSIPAIRVGRSWLIHRDAAATYRKHRKKPGRPKAI